jgi:hypothetical protein
MPDVSTVVEAVALFFTVGLALGAVREVIRRGQPT